MPQPSDGNGDIGGRAAGRFLKAGRLAHRDTAFQRDEINQQFAETDYAHLLCSFTFASYGLRT
jgi:hypothetical protein